MSRLLSKKLEEYNQFLMLAAVAIGRSRNNRKRKHRWWIREIIRKRVQHGAFYHLVKELELDVDEFKCCFRLSKVQFGYVLSMVEDLLTRRNFTKEAISAKQRLAICLRFLTSGETYTSLDFSYRVAQPTISKIVPEVCRVIWDKLAPVHMRMPASAEEWRLVAEIFYDKWQFPNCVGANTLL